MPESVVRPSYSARMFEELITATVHPHGELDQVRLAFGRPLEPCPRCGGLLSEAHLEAADAGWVDATCPACGVVLAA